TDPIPFRLAPKGFPDPQLGGRTAHLTLFVPHEGFLCEAVGYPKCHFIFIRKREFNSKSGWV
ncbi:MAG: hypothetical protein ACRC4N_09810, partial [Gammaproteobacteria bacterium]